MPTARALLSDSLRFLRRHGLSVLFIVLVIYIPIELILSALPFDDEQFLKSTAREFRRQWTLEALLGVLCSMAVAHLVLADHEGRILTTSDSLWLAASRWRASVGTQFLRGLIYLGALLALVVPLIFVGIATIFTVPLVALRDQSGVQAIKASWALVRGRWWAVFRLMALLGLAELVLAAIVIAPFIFLPEHYLLDVASSLLLDIMAALFTVATVKAMLQLEAHPVADRLTPRHPVLSPCPLSGPSNPASSGLRFATLARR
jgi:hypothetical protein